MPRRAGTADLPLHGGRVPPWLADRMTRLGAVIAQAIVHHYGRQELLRRLASPCIFGRLEHPGEVRVGAARRDEARSRMRVWRRARPRDSNLDARPRISADNAGEPVEVPALQLASSPDRIHGAADRAADPSVTISVG